MITRFYASLLVASVLLVGVADAAVSAAPVGRTTRPIQRFERLVFRGDSALSKLSASGSATVAAPQDVRLKRGLPTIDIHPSARRHPPVSAGAPIAVPFAPSRPVVSADADFFGFRGLTDVDQFSAGSGEYANTQFDSEPPDQGLCVGNGFVVEGVNNAVAVYSTLGTPLSAPTALNEFFELAPEFSSFPNYSTNYYGPFLANPKCYFDHETQRWFLTAMEIDADPFDGSVYSSNHSSIQLAVSQSADPTARYSIYAFDTSGPAANGCPCFADQPLLGADANGLYISTNEFRMGALRPISLIDGFEGAQIYALSKTELAKGKLPTIVHFDTGALPGANPWYSIQPASAPDTVAASHTSNGTEYFLSALDFIGDNDNRIAVWAMTNSRSLRNLKPDVSLQHIVIGSESYGLPPAAVQKVGPAPLAAEFRLPLEALDTEDDRMNQVVFAQGRLWSGLNTAVRFGSHVNAGVAFFAVAPAFDRSGSFTAKIEQQGYVAVAGENVMYPSIGVNSSGGAVMAATLSGPQYYPTAVYLTQDGKVHLEGRSAGPDDGASGYGLYAGGYSGYYGCCSNGARWGAYSAAVADRDGSVWIASEFIPGVRTVWANWGTFIGHVHIHRE